MSVSDGEQWAYVFAEDVALTEADIAATNVASAFNRARASHRLSPEVVVHRDIGPDDGPVYDFRLNVDLQDDLPSSEYPMDEIQELASGLRAEIAKTEVDRWRWVVSVGTQAGAKRR